MKKLLLLALLMLSIDMLAITKKEIQKARDQKYTFLFWEEDGPLAEKVKSSNRYRKRVYSYKPSANVEGCADGYDFCDIETYTYQAILKLFINAKKKKTGYKVFSLPEIEKGSQWIDVEEYPKLSPYKKTKTTKNVTKKKKKQEWIIVIDDYQPNN